MSEFMLQYDFLRIGEKDLQFGMDEIAEYMKQKALTLTDEELAEVLKNTRGYPPMVAMYSEHIEVGETIDKTMYTAVSRNLGGYFDRVFFCRWENDVQQLLLALCQYPQFTLPMAEMLTGSKDTYRNLRYCYHVCSFLIKIDDKIWAFRDYFADFLKWKQRVLWTEEMLLENYRRGALYYETIGDFENALLYYHKAGMNEQIKNLLIQNARKHPGNGSYYQLRKYYMELPEDIIKENPVLMCGMSMLNSIMFHPEESEKWYRILQEYGNSPYRNSDERKEARTRLAYLDIGLPHRAAKGLIGILRKSAKLSANHEINLPEFSITGNLPSLMNGGLDYCDWSLIDDKLARLMAAPLEIILKNSSKGLVNIALAESGFEKASMDSYELMTRLNNGYQSADNAQNIEMCFAAIGVLVKCHLVNGQLPTAKGILESFRNKVEKENAVQLFDNLYAFETWLSLYTGDGSKSDEYLLSAPDEKQEFCTLDRYRIIIKIRCLIAKGKLAEAMDSALTVDGYFISYGRHYMWMENQILKAIILYRQGNDCWQKVLTDGLKMAQHYHFVRVVSLESGAIQPLIQNLKTDEISKAFLKAIQNETRKTALLYPDYMHCDTMEIPKLTQQEQRILAMLCAGKKTEEICEECGITYNGLKFHNRNIYQKLGVTSRAGAERAAARQTILLKRPTGIYGSGLMRDCTAMTAWNLRVWTSLTP